jgi:hypothetical protein
MQMGVGKWKGNNSRFSRCKVGKWKGNSSRFSRWNLNKISKGLDWCRWEWGSGRETTPDSADGTWTQPLKVPGTTFLQQIFHNRQSANRIKFWVRKSAKLQIVTLRQLRYFKNLIQVRKFVALHFAKLICGSPIFVIRKYKHTYPLLTALSAA